MKIEYHKTLSVNLGREIEYKTYGDGGRGVLVFPSQDKRFYEWEDNGMISSNWSLMSISSFVGFP